MGETDEAMLSFTETPVVVQNMKDKIISDDLAHQAVEVMPHLAFFRTPETGTELPSHPSVFVLGLRYLDEHTSMI